LRDGILKQIADENAKKKELPCLAVLLIGDNPVCQKYAELKKKMAEKIGVQANLYLFDQKDSEQDILDCIEFLNSDPETQGVMIQIPIDKKFDRDKLIAAISTEKDVDGLRYCAGLESNFKPPVVLAIIEALRQSLGSSNLEAGIWEKKKISLIGHGFLVGNPLERTLKELGATDLTVVTSENILDSKFQILNSDIVISAVGKAGIVTAEMVKEGVILIDAGTTEQNGELIGDISAEAYKKASFYTPVPGGIGPATVGMLFSNLAKSKSFGSVQDIK